MIAANIPHTDHDAVEFFVSALLLRSGRCKRLLYNYRKADFNAFKKSYPMFPGFASDIE